MQQPMAYGKWRIEALLQLDEELTAAAGDEQPETPWAYSENWRYSTVTEDDPPRAKDAEDARWIAEMLHEEVLVEDGRSGDTPPRLIPSPQRRRMIRIARGEPKPDRPQLPLFMSPLTGAAASRRKRSRRDVA